MMIIEALKSVPGIHFGLRAIGQAQVFRETRSTELSESGKTFIQQRATPCEHLAQAANVPSKLAQGRGTSCVYI